MFLISTLIKTNPVKTVCAAILAHSSPPLFSPVNGKTVLEHVYYSMFKWDSIKPSARYELHDLCYLDDFKGRYASLRQKDFYPGSKPNVFGRP